MNSSHRSQQYRSRFSKNSSEEPLDKDAFSPRARKSLGQHFLRSRAALVAMRDACDPTHTDIIVEVGPGDGALTAEILPFAGKMIVIEKDSRMIPLLQEKFKKEITEGKLDIIEGDALSFDPSVLRFYKNFDYHIIGNIPYYITGALLRKFLTDAIQPTSITFLVQKEVAERITGGKRNRGIEEQRNKKKESILSLSVKAYGTPEYVRTVKAGSFSPAPKVDSAILHIAQVSRKNFKNKKEEERFFEIVKTGFAQKRKTLAGNLTKLASKENVARAFAGAGIAANARAEDVNIQKWFALRYELD